MTALQLFTVHALFDCFLCLYRYCRDVGPLEILQSVGKPITMRTQY
jgi:hypothetical protein